MSCRRAENHDSRLENRSTANIITSSSNSTNSNSNSTNSNSSSSLAKRKSREIARHGKWRNGRRSSSHFLPISSLGIDVGGCTGAGDVTGGAGAIVVTSRRPLVRPRFCSAAEGSYTSQDAMKSSASVMTRPRNRLGPRNRLVLATNHDAGGRDEVLDESSESVARFARSKSDLLGFTRLTDELIGRLFFVYVVFFLVHSRASIRWICSSAWACCWRPTAVSRAPTKWNASPGRWRTPFWNTIDSVCLVFVVMFVTKFGRFPPFGWRICNLVFLLVFHHASCFLRTLAIAILDLGIEFTVDGRVLLDSFLCSKADPLASPWPLFCRTG